MMIVTNPYSALGTLKPGMCGCDYQSVLLVIDYANAEHHPGGWWDESPHHPFAGGL